MTGSLYDDLGVSPSATEAEIKAAGRQRSKATHPDVGGDAAEFAKVRNALVILSDPAKRQRYDETGETDFRSDPEALELQEAGQLLMQGLVTILQDQSLDPARVDVIPRIRQYVQRQLDGHRKNRADFDRAIKRAEQFEKRLSRKKKAKCQDWLGDFLRNQAAEFRKGMAVTDRAIRVAEKALEMVETYEYQTEGSDMQRAMAEAYWTAGGARTGSMFGGMFNSGV